MDKLTIDQKTFENAPRVTMGRREISLGSGRRHRGPADAGCETTSGGFGEFLVSDAQIQQASQAAWSQALQQERVSRDPALRRRVERVGNRMVPISGLTQYDWEFVVFESDTQNAWVLPGGKVAFYRGILDTMRNDDEVAVVMGHEIAHVRRNHAAQRARQQAAAGVGSGHRQCRAGRRRGGERRPVGGYSRRRADLWRAAALFAPARAMRPISSASITCTRPATGPARRWSFWEAMSRRSAAPVASAGFCPPIPMIQQRMAALRQHIQARGYA
jgi:predicted Zn-dependent protease